MSNDGNKIDLNLEKTHADKKARRRELYKLKQSEKKDALLAQARTTSLIMSSCFADLSFSNTMPSKMDCFASTLVSNEQTSILGCNSMRVNYIDSAYPTINYAILKAVPWCKYWAAKRFEYETPAFCCSNGVVRLISHQIPTALRNLYLENTDESRQFRAYIKTYNNIFTFTSLGVNYDKELAKKYKGISTFRVQGKMHHFIDDLVPATEKERNLQLYFFDTENELKN